MSDSRPAWIISAQAQGTTVQIVVVDGKSYDYTITTAGLEPDLPYVVGFTDAGVLFISEEVKPEYRQHILTHEVREKTHFRSTPRMARCVRTLRAELDDARSDLSIHLAEYVKERSRFFDALVVYYESRPEQQLAVEPGFLESIKQSQEFLRQLIA